VIGPHRRETIGERPIVRRDDRRQPALATAQEDVEGRGRFGALQLPVLLRAIISALVDIPDGTDNGGDRQQVRPDAG